jgi:dCMP deaminase
MREYCSRCGYVIRRLIDTHGNMSTPCCPKFGMPIYDQDTITPAIPGRLKWDCRFLGLARHVSDWSKDPSTQVGAVIAAPDNSIVSVGYNGFARGVSDAPELYADRDLKYRKVVHAEINAILFARGRDLSGCTLYTVPFMPCAPCSGIVIQAGISRVVAPTTPADKVERWKSDMQIAIEQFREAGVELVIIDEDTSAGSTQA